MKIACSRCGSNIIFNPDTQSCFCTHCKSNISINEFKIIDNFSDENYNNYTCSSCGAQLIVDEYTTITTCAYCGSNQFVKEKYKGELKPDLIIPFKINRDTFIKKYYRHIIKNYMLLPDDFIKNSSITQVKGIYVPFYLYEIEANTKYRGLAFKSNNDERKNKYFETEFDIKLKTMQDASIRMDDDILSSLEPFDISNVASFTPAFLGGFSAEAITDSIENTEKKITHRIVKQCEKELYHIANYSMYRNNMIANDYEPYRNRVYIDDEAPTDDIVIKGRIQINDKIMNRSIVLVPIWFFNIKYRDNKYQCAMNGQTGKMALQIPFGRKEFISLCTVSYIALTAVPLLHSIFNKSYYLVIALSFMYIMALVYGLNRKNPLTNLKHYFNVQSKVLGVKMSKYSDYTDIEYKNIFKKDKLDRLSIQVIDEEKKVVYDVDRKKYKK